ncbi:MAG: ATP-binding protein, partial [Proteobacteria bacterium]
SNAVKYAPGQSIKIRAAQLGARIQLIIEDSGPGIDFSQKELIFERFERQSSSHAVDGLGLGLYIVKRIVEGHGGYIRAQPVEPHGTAFVIELPIIPPLMM